MANVGKSVVAMAAEVPLNTEEFQLSKVCRTEVLTWSTGLSGGVLRTRLGLQDFIDMFRDGVGMGTDKCSIQDEDFDGGECDLSLADELPPGNMFG